VEYRHLGRSGLLVSEIAYGNWVTQGSQVDDDDSVAIVRTALDSGITFFDTADVYANGRAEEVLGRCLKGERREDLVISTKVFWSAGPGRNDAGLSRKHLLEGIDSSLRRLQMDYVDLYQAHRFDYATPLEETMSAFADIVRMGKALYIGVSEWKAGQIRAAQKLAVELGVPLISNQPQYSMLWRVIEAEVMPACDELGISQIVWSPIAQGVLSGKYVAGQPFPEGSRAGDEKSGGAYFVSRFFRDDLLERVQRLRPLAEQAGLSMSQLAIAWVLRSRGVASAIVGASRPQQVLDNVKASGVKLDADLLLAIDEVLGPVVERDPAKTFSPEHRPKPAA
jgi:aryl-alcohol dehydrogenase-like predicted oxidoreductase